MLQLGVDQHLLDTTFFFLQMARPSSKSVEPEAGAAGKLPDRVELFQPFEQPPRPKAQQILSHQRARHGIIVEQAAHRLARSFGTQPRHD